MKTNMINSRRWLVACALTLCFGVTVTARAESEGKTGEDVVKDFVAHIDGLDSVGDDLKKQIRETIQQLREDDYARIEAITASLAMLYPEYEKAITATQNDDVESAIEQLRQHIHSADSFLAADSSFYLARTLMNLERHEEALPILEKLSEQMANYTLHAGPSVYFSGVAQANLLENQRAIKSFAKFLEEYPQSPERLRVAAWRQIEMIQAIEEGGMQDILQRMDFSRRRLGIEKTDDVTQKQQDKVVNMLAKLIREMEKKECSGGNCQKNCEGQSESQQNKPGQGDSDSEGKSDSGGSSNNPNGVVDRRYDDGPASPWSRLRPRLRDADNSAIKQKLPSRYRNVVEKYYEATAGNSDGSKK